MYLNTHSAYSFKYGTMKPETLLQECQKCGISRVALTDINSTAGSLSFVRLSEKYDIKPILGIDFRNSARQQFVGIAMNNQGFYELNSFLSPLLHEGLAVPECAPTFDNAFIIYPWRSFKNRKLRHNEFLGVRPQDLTRLRFSEWKN
ncbi:MAG: PHP domain-containing protein, partial [Cyclobacteriaceae bacterium]